MQSESGIVPDFEVGEEFHEEPKTYYELKSQPLKSRYSGLRTLRRVCGGLRRDVRGKLLARQLSSHRSRASVGKPAAAACRPSVEGKKPRDWMVLGLSSAWQRHAFTEQSAGDFKNFLGGE
ncbi:hypothetical protein MC885_003884 [Smutsia gigantea]|nr:hypothetical protein MC885_003884 [Smutsia gigantea]